MLEVKNYEGYEYWERTIALPSGELMHWTGSPSLEHFLLVGGAWAEFTFSTMMAHGISKPHILDIGCGCGKTARQFALIPGLRYTGFDLMLPAIEWCDKAFGVYKDRFSFHHFNGISQHYNPDGKIAASEYVFPCDSGTVDIAIAASLFTHLYEPDAIHYLEESARVLVPGGLAIFSIHDRLDEGTFAGNEACINVNGAYFDKLALAAGLERIEREDNLCGQQVQIYRRN